MINIDTNHYDAFNTALANVLHTEIAERTYAEIVDGIPTADTWSAYRGWRHDIIDAHHELCPGTLETARHHRNDLRPENLSFNPSVRVPVTPPPPVFWPAQRPSVSNSRWHSLQLLQAYQGSTIGSRQFRLRLIELLAVACHDLAASLHQEYGGGFHRGAHSWRQPKSWSTRWPAGVAPPPSPEPLPTVFYHSAYDAFDQYPRGVADMVGYWAEARIFGGVVTFDRGEDGTAVRTYLSRPDNPLFEREQPSRG